MTETTQTQQDPTEYGLFGCSNCGALYAAYEFQEKCSACGSYDLNPLYKDQIR